MARGKKGTGEPKFRPTLSLDLALYKKALERMATFEPVPFEEFSRYVAWLIREDLKGDVFEQASENVAAKKKKQP